MKLRKRSAVIIGLLLFLACWSVLLWYVHPETIVGHIGVENTYLVVFLLAVFGGLSSVTGTSFFVALATFAGGGANPGLLGVAGGIGIFLSDSVFFLLAHHGLRTWKESSELTLRIKKRIEKVPEWMVLVFVYLYIGWTPLPNDALMLALGTTHLTYRKLAPILLAGSLTIATLVATLASMGLWIR